MKKEKQQITKLVIKVEFEFAYEKNAENVALSLMKAGYYVKLRYDSSKWTLLVFTDRF